MNCSLCSWRVYSWLQTHKREMLHVFHGIDTNSSIRLLLPFYSLKTITDIHEFNLTVYFLPTMLVKGCNKPTEKLSALLPHIPSNRLCEEVHITDSVGTHTSGVDPNDSIWYSCRCCHVSCLPLPSEKQAHSLFFFFIPNSLCWINKLIIFEVHNKKILKPGLTNVCLET